MYSAPISSPALFYGEHSSVRPLRKPEYVNTHPASAVHVQRLLASPLLEIRQVCFSQQPLWRLPQSGQTRLKRRRFIHEIGLDQALGLSLQLASTASSTMRAKSADAKQTPRL